MSKCTVDLIYQEVYTAKLSLAHIVLARIHVA